MNYYKVEQRTEAWHKLRLGIPTASEFSNLITPAKAEPSKSSDAYLNRLLAERILGRPLETPETEYMTRGIELEDEAVRAYEFQCGVETEPGGFWTRDDGLAGASPDRLIGVDGILEIKCPAIHTHVGYMRSRKLEDTYRPQLQGQLWLTGRKWVDVVSYFPGLPLVVIRQLRDEAYIGKLKAAVEFFVMLLLREWAEIEQAYGPFARPEPPAAVDSADFLSVDDVEAIIAAQERER